MEYRLISVTNNSSFRILDFKLDMESRKRLNNMGIFRNDLYIRTAGNGMGPVLIQNLTNHSTPIALGRELAEGIVVELTEV
ncbi:MAG: hypothetical protein RO257_03085 [Candidatus Kapabacteria bacterium]|nr:hypothetical protein [Candidatus Kapabacteria bacterium]